ncbi:putative GTP-binding protein EngB [Candidatus Mycoplasma haematohominis]|uniref:Putative GTP-binding protein EngB n=1 Tax=Candidatus Mycoplasma haematohominis TaxID=1494318 RepID=A0A478FQK4_9MOLU|nr:putative GTP-binding protein EngB [Candidatus Mycoplasma haemohominis]
MARFVTSVSKFNDSVNLSDLPDIALVGPSNSGKSSLINTLAKARIALISNKPGKTRTLNYYEFDRHYLVDTPGYGFSQGSKTDRTTLLSILDSYFCEGERPIVGVFQIISSHGLTSNDMEIFSFLTSRFHNYTLLINKIDKLSNNQQKNLFNEVLKTTKLSEDSVFLISAKEGVNINLVNKRIRDYLN